MGENKAAGEVRYIHGEYGKGTWSFLGGHDPEDYQHFVGDPVTELDLHRQSAGYRLILNNILFPAARKKPVSYTHLDVYKRQEYQFKIIVPEDTLFFHRLIKHLVLYDQF